MRSDSGATRSIWMDTAEVPQYQPLAANLEADVCVVGAGIAGMTTAYLLTREGKGVVVLDDGPVAGGETGRTTAHLTWALDDFYMDIERMHGAEGARIAAESHRTAVDRIEEIVRGEGIDCDFERLPGYWFAEDADGKKELAEERDAARRAGAGDVELIDRIPGVPFETAVALRFANQATFHPLKYVSALARAIVRDGGRIHCSSHVAELVKKSPRPQVKTSDGHTVTAGAVVFATNAPVNDWVKIHTKQAAYRTFVVGIRNPAGTVERGLYWDNLDPYHYVRLAEDAGGEVLIVGGQDHKTGQADDQEERFAALVQWTRERFPQAGNELYRWSGQVIEPNDYMAFIGRNPGDDHIFIATGDSGNGMTHGTIAGILITDLILGRDNPWEKLYDPSRKSLRAAPEFLRENLNVAAQYRDLVRPGEVSSAEDIAPDAGAILRDGAKLLAVYRDAGGTLHTRSALCTHLYCVVAWNDTEKTWDCPCHGSRFDRYGKVVNGPAIADLPGVDGDGRQA
ncbi:MAG TPA: FAD-dependent oxidoreductase [Gemmatimonadales bacterium]|nr:FAD-dependent oxidoreductase [Gemmatimonadales bacterium]